MGADCSCIKEENQNQNKQKKRGNSKLLSKGPSNSMTINENKNNNEFINLPGSIYLKKNYSAPIEYDANEKIYEVNECYEYEEELEKIDSEKKKNKKKQSFSQNILSTSAILTLNNENNSERSTDYTNRQISCNLDQKPKTKPKAYRDTPAFNSFTHSNTQKNKTDELKKAKLRRSMVNVSTDENTNIEQNNKNIKVKRPVSQSEQRYKDLISQQLFM